MSMIKVENLTFAYPSGFDNVFENVSFQIDTDWKLGFIGRNGRGKTTFLNLLLGKYAYSGRIISSVRFDYFPYPVEDKSPLTLEVAEKICPIAEEWEIIRETAYLNLDAGVLYRPFNTLSEGEQTKVLLAALFLNEDRFLLIDEPANHLDYAGRKAVAEYLKKKKSFILVSHDRDFLDGCVDHILALNRTDIEVRNGNFSSWMTNFEKQQESETARNKHLKKDIKRLQQAARRSADWSSRVEATKAGANDKGFVGHKAAKMMKRSKAIEARQKQAIEEKSALLKNAEMIAQLKISPLEFYKDTLLTLSDVEVCYNGESVCQPVSFSVRSGERIALDGPNGSGKSSLLKILIGSLKSYKGACSTASGLVISYVEQNTADLSGSLSDFAAENHIDESLFKAILQKLDFNKTQFERDINSFSNGQKKKVLIAKSLCEKAHLYVWDEPLNYIDLYSRMQIENLIRQFSPTMIFVEHDCAFRKNTATKTVKITKAGGR